MIIVDVTTASDANNSKRGPRFVLAFTAIALGFVAFIGGVVFIGGLGGCNLSWLLCGLTAMFTSGVAYVKIRGVIRRVAGYTVTLQDDYHQHSYR